MKKHQYNKGEHVVYGINGICLIEDIKKPDFARNGTQVYYILKPISNPNSTLYVPVDNEALCSKMRYILSRDEINSLLTGSKGKSIEWVEDKNERASKFHTILSGGIHEDLLLMISCIYLRKQQLYTAGKKLAHSDETLLQSAEKNIKEEFAYSLSISPDEVGSYIRSMLGICEEL